MRQSTLLRRRKNLESRMGKWREDMQLNLSTTGDSGFRAGRPARQIFGNCSVDVEMSVGNRAEVDCTRDASCDGDSTEEEVDARDGGAVSTDDESEPRDCCTVPTEVRVTANNFSSQDPERQINSVINMTSEVCELRKKLQKRMYYLLEPVKICDVTGVEIKYMGDMHVWARNAFISSKTPFADTVQEVIGTPLVDNFSHADEGGEAEAGASFDAMNTDEESPVKPRKGGKHTLGMKRKRSSSPRAGVKVMKAVRKESSERCERCGTVYWKKGCREEHEKQCSYEKVEGNSLQRAMKLAHSMIYLDKTVEVYTKHDKHPLMKDLLTNTDGYSRRLCVGWARRPKKGKSMGCDTAIEEFKGKIREWFNIGSASPSRKISAARMANLIVSMNPYRYDLPTEQQITSFISSLSAEEKRARMQAAKERVVGETAVETAGEEVGRGVEAETPNAAVNGESRSLVGTGDPPVVQVVSVTEAGTHHGHAHGVVCAPGVVQEPLEVRVDAERQAPSEGISLPLSGNRGLGESATGSAHWKSTEHAEVQV